MIPRFTRQRDASTSSPRSADDSNGVQKPAPAARPAPGISIENLDAYYGEIHSLKNVTLDFPPNQVTALIGPSGSGKSTVVRCINRLHEEIPGARATGTVKLGDVDIYHSGVDITAVRRVIGMVFQRPTPFPTMSVFDNVASGLKLDGMRGGRALRDRVEQALRGAGLWDEVRNRLDGPGVGLSGGQQQRLCIARAIAVRPAVILMDEPTSALDPVSTLRIEELLSELRAEFTIIIVTHNMQQSARIADSTAFLLDGEVIEHKPTEELFTHPADERTERYVTGKFG